MGRQLVRQLLISSAVVALGLCAPPVDAQVVTGTITGVVSDDSRAALPEVSVTVTSPALPGGPGTSVTNAQGAYRFSTLPPGVYELEVARPGFTTHVHTDLWVTVGGTIELNITLGVEPVAEAITVTGVTQVVDPRQTGVGRSLGREALETLPTSRQKVTAFLGTLPGVALGNYNSGLNPVIMGSNSTDSSYMVDGMLTNHPSNGLAWAYYDMDAAEEVNLVALGASVEYQQAQGGVMNYVSKAGTNVFRGDGSVYWAPPGLTSVPVTRPCDCPLGETGFKLYKYLDYAAHIGGPIVKNRLWFHGGQTNTGPAIRYPGQPDRPADQQWIKSEVRNTAKVTWRINDRMQFQQSLYYEWWNWLSPDFPTTTTPLEASARYTGDMRYFGSEFTATLSPSSVLTARFFHQSIPYGFNGLGPNLNADTESLQTPGHLDTFTGVSHSNYTAGPSQAYEPIRDDVNVKLNHFVSGSRVDHSIRFGVQIARNLDTGQQVWPGGVLYRDFNGAPDQAQYQSPLVYAAESRSQGVWVEDELTMGRLTMTPGVRFDRMEAISPAAPVVDPAAYSGTDGLCRCNQSFGETGATIPGLGEMFTWNKVSPRMGINLRLTSDSRTVLRGTAGRYYRTVFLNDFAGMHPGITPVTLARFDPATSAYTTIISVTDSTANLAVDANVEAPYTDQYSIGIDREVVRHLGLSATYVHKTSSDHIGWRDIGGIYGTQTVTSPAGPVTVYPLLNAPSERKFLRTNGAGFFSRYNGLVLSAYRRLATHWMLNVNYAYSKTEGLQVPGTTVFASTVGQDPNDYVNLTGRLTPNDRPHVLSVTGSYEFREIGVQVSGNLALMSGLPYAPQIQVVLPQGRRNVNFDEPGSYRLPSEEWLFLRASKLLFRNGPRRLELGVELRNTLQETSDGSLASRVFSSPNFGQQTTWPVPRQLLFRAKGYF